MGRIEANWYQNKPITILQISVPQNIFNTAEVGNYMLPCLWLID